MRWLMNVTKALLALLVLLSAIGLLLPRERHVERRLIIQAPSAQIWALVADPRRWAEWSPWYARDPAARIIFNNPSVGVGADWTWDSKQLGQGHMQFVGANPPERLDYKLQLHTPGLTTDATGNLRLEQLNIGMRVTWTFDTDLGWNPALRWFGIGMNRTIGTDLDNGLARLALIVTPR